MKRCSRRDTAVQPVERGLMLKILRNRTRGIVVSTSPIVAHAGFFRPQDRLNAVNHLQLAEDVGNVIANRLQTELQPFSNFLIGEMRCD